MIICMTFSSLFLYFTFRLYLQSISENVRLVDIACQHAVKDNERNRDKCLVNKYLNTLIKREKSTSYFDLSIHIRLCPLSFLQYNSI